MTEHQSAQAKAIATRRTFAIISHPDAGKTTITEKLLLLGNAIQVAGAVKAKRNERSVTSDWMSMEQQRGISITTAVMQFRYKGCTVNLLDTPGHEDFSEDTYRTLSAVDSVLMIIDGSKGVEERTIKLMNVCRMRDIPIVTFINKFDRECRDGIELLDEIEEVLGIEAAPINWPLGMGKTLGGVYNMQTETVHHYVAGSKNVLPEDVRTQGLDSDESLAKLQPVMGSYVGDAVEQVELIQGATHAFDNDLFLAGKQTPVYFGTALGNFGVREMLDDFVKRAPSPQSRKSEDNIVDAYGDTFSGFVFKIQANMDPKHRDRIAFMRICSGSYRKGMKMRQVRTGKDVRISDAVTFMAGDRTHVEEALSGDIIGLHNHGTIQIGDTFSSGEPIKFKGVPNFAPELFRVIILRDPLKMKQLRNGIKQLSEEGSVQVFFPLNRNDIIVGAVGVLQFEVVAFRLKDEYKVEASYEPVNLHTARWIQAEKDQDLQEIKNKAGNHLAIDGGGFLAYLAPTRVNLQLAEERYENLSFNQTREI